jgi:hypothetical protein
VIAAIVLQDGLRPRKSLARAVGLDFRAFYCSGEAVGLRANPYTVEPLRACEHRVQWASDWSRDLVIPSPLPAYDLALLAWLARLPYAAAKIVWYCVLVGFLFLAAYVLTRMTRFPALFVLAALLAGDGALCLLYGQLVPIVIAALSTSSYLLERRRPGWAALAASASMIEPHLGLPACVALFVWMPRCRPALAVALGSLAIFGALNLGIERTVSYFTQVLPAQAAAELVATDQYSLSHVLYIAGFQDRAALLLGSISYAVMLVVGVIVARRAADALGSCALIATLPAAAAALGGSYVHEEQLLASLPAALLLAAFARRGRAVAWTALALLVFPWFSFATPSRSSDVAFALLSLAVVGWLGALATRDVAGLRRLPLAASAPIAFVLLVGLFRQLPGTPAANFTAQPRLVVDGGALAATNWAAYLRASPQLSVPSSQKESEKVPAWIALALIVLTSAFQYGRPAAGRSPGRHAVAQPAREHARSRPASRESA